ncbi:hypothetical protein ASPBRDRAFT_197607 [Aspergillus brasiliensis CBS 101740]|uniref:Uncharacterized protein n=1 Tax=Aspergillus brasiliensis (strain CBS 101740 / IMI 381727 / IBT 21946) TaxID=767769 RepID=A0A1L9UE05_ASPBC|nr:hypothetical protein ASPBRDRAFT_197607 [Aspergillus brasiliensis CBS 101740]
MSAPFIPDFRSIGQNIYFYEPDLNDTPIPDRADAHPSLIILCPWYGGATPRRVAKYASGYRQRYPRTSILLINTSFRDYVARSLHSIDANLTPARDTIIRTLQSTPEAKILLHVFSNGGCNTVTQLARAMKSASTSAEPADFKSALKLIVFDCCPGDSSFERLYAAGATALPTAQPGRAIGTAVLYSTTKVGYALQGIGAMRSIDDYRADLNDPELFGEARRLYLYSRTDEMIPWQDVEGHMIEASRRGYAVTGVSFEDGKHCGLVMGDERRYWDAVERAWEGGKISVGERSRL